MAELHAKNLVRTVARAFYSDDAIFVLDALCRERYLVDNEHAGRGPLEEKFGIQAKQVRRTLQGLYEDCLVEKYVRSYTDVKSDKVERKKKRTLWYINYLHFVKLIRLRLHFMAKIINEHEEEAVTTEALFTCPNCGSEFDLITAMQFSDPDSDSFFCENCFLDSDEKFYLIDPAGGAGGAATQAARAGGNAKVAAAKPKRLKDKRAEQLAELSGFRDGIFEILHKIDTFPIPPPTNLPADHIENDMHEKVAEIQAEQEAAANGGTARAPGGGGRNQATFVDASGQSVQVKIVGMDDDDRPGAAGSSAADEAASNEGPDYAQASLPAWMTRDVTGAVSSNAIQDAQERAAKRHKAAGSVSASASLARGGASALLQAKEEAAKLAAGVGATAASAAGAQTESQTEEDRERAEYEKATMVKVNGQDKRLYDVTEEDQNNMSGAEYEAYAAAKRRATGEAAGSEGGGSAADDDDDDMHEFM